MTTKQRKHITRPFSISVRPSVRPHDRPEKRALYTLPMRLYIKEAKGLLFRDKVAETLERDTVL